MVYGRKGEPTLNLSKHFKINTDKSFQCCHGDNSIYQRIEKEIVKIVHLSKWTMNLSFISSPSFVIVFVVINTVASFTQTGAFVHSV